MCGRIEVKRSVDGGVYNELGIPFESKYSLDLRPTQDVACIHFQHGQLSQVNTQWGIKPGWAKNIIINAQSETVTQKKTFSSAYALNRCVVPCTGWFEWTGETGSKTKYRFSHKKEGGMFFMAGIMFPENKHYSLVTLTAEADDLCSRFHSRMPLLIGTREVKDWLSLPTMNQKYSNEPYLNITVGQ